ncbi:MAG: DJ-1/PfpI family protein, partial [Candidatus Aenigmatarchaeota archaeon]
TSHSSLKEDIEEAGGEYRDSKVVVDGNLITSRKPDDLPAFMKKVLEKLRE